MFDRVPQPTLVAASVLLEGDVVRILDRRVFPFEKTWVVCRTVEDVAKAIEDMVTQSSGPWFAAAGGMALAAQAADREGTTVDARRSAIHRSGERLKATRKTNNHIREVVADLLAVADGALDGGEDLTPAVTDAAVAAATRYEERSERLGRFAAPMVPDGATILTHCWAESYLTQTVAAVLESGKKIQAICTETRPFLQGARLVAESLAEMGVPTRLITDGMPAHLMSRGEVDIFITAADRVTMDGHVVNKVGTLQIALAAHAFGVPYLALVHAPDIHAATIEDVEMEDRNGDEVLFTLGHRTASTRVTGIYPAFDATPPQYVSAIATDPSTGNGLIGVNDAHDTLPVTGIPRSGLPARALVVGDPFRAERISRQLEDSAEVAHKREYRTFRGLWNGTDVVVSSHGVGGPGALCHFRELMDAGVDTVIRLGTAGSLAPGIADGDLVVADSCVRDDGVTHQLMPESYPASSTAEVVLALTAAARSGPGQPCIPASSTWVSRAMSDWESWPSRWSSRPCSSSPRHAAYAPVGRWSSTGPPPTSWSTPPVTIPTAPSSLRESPAP